jgi:ParB family chromosome partitioning protein
MPKNSLNVSLKGADDIFSTEESRQEQQREQVQQIPIGELFPFKNHPFKVLDDESMQRTVESVEQYGVLSPLIARPRPEGGYEIISGHRRQHAAQLAGLDALPVIVRQMDDDAAVLLMVDSNLQRENILPSERAFAYKMKLEAIKNQGARSDLTSGQIVQKSKLSIERVAEDAGEGYKTVQRFIRLTNLIPELLDMVDEKKIAFNPAVELSYLDESQQRDFLEAMNDTQNAPSLSQAQRLKKLAQEGHFSYDVAFAVMGEEKKDELDKVVIKNDTLRKYFPRSYTPKQMEDTIIKLLEQWQRKQQRRMNADLYRNERPDGVFFFCKQKEKTPMKNNVTRTIRSEEITIDVRICAALAANRGGEVYLAAIAPDMELTVITLDEAPDILPCFEEDNACLNLPNTSLLLCYNPAQVLKMGGKHYLTGPVILARTNMDGRVISLTIDEVYLFVRHEVA